MSSDKDMKPCPFCGTQPKVKRHRGSGEVTVGCNNVNCAAMPSVFAHATSIMDDTGDSWHYDWEDGEAKAIEIWNDRE